MYCKDYETQVLDYDICIASCWVPKQPTDNAGLNYVSTCIYLCMYVGVRLVCVYEYKYVIHTIVCLTTAP